MRIKVSEDKGGQIEITEKSGRQGQPGQRHTASSVARGCFITITLPMAWISAFGTIALMIFDMFPIPHPKSSTLGASLAPTPPAPAFMTARVSGVDSIAWRMCISMVLSRNGQTTLRHM